MIINERLSHVSGRRDGCNHFIPNYDFEEFFSVGSMGVILAGVYAQIKRTAGI